MYRDLKNYYSKIVLFKKNIEKQCCNDYNTINKLFATSVIYIVFEMLTAKFLSSI